MTRWCPAPRSACGSLHVSPATLTHRTVSSATGLDGVDVIEYEIINEMCFLVSIFFLSFCVFFVIGKVVGQTQGRVFREDFHFQATEALVNKWLL